jgi:hypothetical protein
MLLLENISHEDLKKYLKEFYTYALTRLKKIDREPKVIFKHDQKNADDFFGKTGYYDPDEEKIVLYVSGRHAKDILRSFAHELIHHYQKCTGESDTVDLSATSDPSYALHNDGLREMEKQAFKWGNMIFRDWCDMKKTQKRETTMAESKKDLVELVLERVSSRLINEAKKAKKKKPMKPEPEGQDLNGDGKKGHGEVPAYLDAGDVKEKKSSGKVPKQLKKYVKSGEVKKESVKKEKENLQESVEHPYPELFQKKDRLFNDRFGNYENLIYEELIKRTIK